MTDSLICKSAKVPENIIDGQNMRNSDSESEDSDFSFDFDDDHVIADKSVQKGENLQVAYESEKDLYKLILSYYRI